MSLPKHTRSIIEVLFLDYFLPFWTTMKNKIEHLPEKDESRSKFKRFFKKKNVQDQSGCGNSRLVKANTRRLVLKFDLDAVL